MLKIQRMESSIVFLNNAGGCKIINSQNKMSVKRKNEGEREEEKERKESVVYKSSHFFAFLSHTYIFNQTYNTE